MFFFLGRYSKAKKRHDNFFILYSCMTIKRKSDKMVRKKLFRIHSLENFFIIFLTHPRSATCHLFSLPGIEENVPSSPLIG